MRRFGRASTFYALTMAAGPIGLALEGCAVVAPDDCTTRASCASDDAGTTTPGVGNDATVDAADEELLDGAGPDRVTDVVFDAPNEDSGRAVLPEASAETGIPDATNDVAGNDASLPDASVADASVADVSAVDAAGDVASEASLPTCNPLNPFGTPVLVAGIESTSTEGGLRLSTDELTGYFWSSRPGGPGTVNLYVTTRTDPNAAFGNVTLLANVNSSGTTYDPTVTGDGLTLAFGSDRATDAGIDDIFLASRAAATGNFSTPTALAVLNTTSNDEQPFFLPDGSEIYFSSDRTGTLALYRAFATAGQFGAPTAITELNAAGANEHPAVTADDLTIVFSSTQAGGQGNNDVWIAQRTSPTAAFGTAVDLTTVNTTSKDIPDWLSADGCRLYLHSDRSGAVHEYLAVRP